MATQRDPTDRATATQAPPVQNGAGGQLVEFDRFIDDQLRKTRGHVRSVDIAGSLMLLAAGTLVYFLTAAMFDHWIVAGGLGFWGRTLFFVIYVAAAATFLATRVLPLVLRRINPLYAAQTIERSRPSLKNALVNFLFFRANPAGLNPVVYEAVEEQAATHLAHGGADAAVDRSQLIKVGYVLLGIMAVCAAYTILSPKNLIRSVGRIAMPWAEIGAPTQTAIVEIEPGSTQAFRGQQLTVSARVQGLPDDGKVLLYYTTADKQVVDRVVEMPLADDGYRHACRLPADQGSLQQDVRYRIEAGDAISEEFTIDVVAAPTIFVQAVEYKYPSYTGLLAQRVEQQGDVKGIEGTEVTLDALANSDIQAAYVDFDCDGQPDQRMQVDGQRAKATFVLALQDDRATPTHSSYQLVFKNTAGQENPQPVRHQIEVARDIAPEIEFVAPARDDIDLPANASIEWELVGNDPDFALRMVKLSATAAKKPLFDKIVLDEERRGQFVAKYRFDPSALGLEAGDVVEYSAVAEDNKHPAPNRSETSTRRIRIVSPDTRGGQDQVARNDQQPGAQQPANDPDQRDGDNNDQRDGQPDKNRQPEKSAKSNDAQPADEKGDGQPQPPDNTKSEQPSGSEKGAGQEASPERQAGDQPSADRQQPDRQPGEQQSQQRDGQQGQGNERGDGTQGQNQPEGQSERVASDGSNDGDAIERILKHRGDQEGESDEQRDSAGEQGGKQDERQPADRSGKQGDKEPSDEPRPEPSDRRDGGQSDRRPGENQLSQREQSNDKGQSDKQSGGQEKGDARSTPTTSERPGDKSAGEAEKQPSDADAPQRRPQSDSSKSNERSARPADRREGASDEQPDADADTPPGERRQADKQQPGGEKPADKQEHRGGDAQESGTPEKGDGQQKQTTGQGAKSKTDPSADQNPQSKDAQRPEAKGGDGEHDMGESGAGQKSDDDQGSPAAKKQAQPRDKSQRPSPGDEDAKDPEKGQAESKSEKESDSEGQSDGEHSGGGKRGGGQKANKPGTGGAGQNTAADEGAGASNERGQGETGERAGRDRESDQATGEKGSKPGQGSGDKPSSGKGDQKGNRGSGESPADASDGSPTGNQPQNAAPGGGTPSGGTPGGRQNDQPPPDAPYKPSEAVADKANLDYARRATDMALEHLKNELRKDQPDPELLKQLGWTRDDLAAFVRRWESMRQAAQAPGDQGASAQQELDETLRSLGLRPRATSLRSNAARDDRVQGMKESRRTTAPPEYAEQTEAYTQGTARGGK